MSNLLTRKCSCCDGLGNVPNPRWQEFDPHVHDFDEFEMKYGVPEDWCPECEGEGQVLTDLGKEVVDLIISTLLPDLQRHQRVEHGDSLEATIKQIARTVASDEVSHHELWSH